MKVNVIELIVFDVAVQRVKHCHGDDLKPVRGPFMGHIDPCFSHIR